MKKKIDNNNLIPWFTQDHGTLPKAYLKSCQKFFDELQASSRKRLATSMPQLQHIYQNQKANDN
jgi:hypothetical protein